MDSKKADLVNSPDEVIAAPEYSWADRDNSPPSYSQNPSEDARLPAETLLLAGDAIHSTSSPASCLTPLYKLSRDIGLLRQSNTKVELSRFERYIRNRTSANSPEVSAREKHIFNLIRPPAVTTPPFEYHIESVSSSNLGHIGLKRYHRVVSSGYQAWRATMAQAGADLVAKEVVFVAKAQGKERYEWRNGADSGHVLAYDTIDDGIFCLEIVEAMTRKQRDALVGVWCLRIWREIANSNLQPLSWEEVKRILRTRTNEFPSGTGWGI